MEQLTWLFDLLVKSLRAHLGDIFFAMYLRQELARAKPLWVETFMRLWEDNYNNYAAEQFLMYREELGINYLAPNFWNLHREDIRAGVEQRVEQIFRTTENRWTRQGPPDTDQEMLDTIREDLTSRKKLIAALEVLTMTEQAADVAVNALGASQFEKEWLSMDDEDVRNTHAAQHGYVVPVGSVFPNGLRYPGDTSTGNASEYLNCRCVARYRLRGAQHEGLPAAWPAIQGPSIPIDYRIGPNLPFGLDG